MDADLPEADEQEIARLQRALSLASFFVFHLIVADSRPLLYSALMKLQPNYLWHTTRREFLATEAATEILKSIDQAILGAEGKPLLIDAMDAQKDDRIWTLVFRRLNTLRNGIERRHPAPLLLAVTPEGETVFGHEAPDLWSKAGSGMRLVAKVPPWQSQPPATSQLPPLADAQSFENFCFELFSALWMDPGAQKHGRSGQRQAGVDIFGKTKGEWIGVQCKVKARLTTRDVDESVAQAQLFKPPLRTFILASTGRRDADLQEHARKLSARMDFGVQVWSWDDLLDALLRQPNLIGKMVPRYWPGFPLPTRGQAISLSRLPRSSEMFFGRAAELQQLEKAWHDPKIHVVVLVAQESVGKTTLLARFMYSLAEHGFDKADFFGWSFYGQGSQAMHWPELRLPKWDDAAPVSADSFIDSALRFFGDSITADSAAPAQDKGCRLAKLLAERRALLALDNIDPLQHSSGPLAGELKDPGLQALLQGLAQQNAGLCVVATRARIADLARWEGVGVQHWNLGKLDAGTNESL